MSNGDIADGALEGGLTETGEITFLCRAFYYDTIEDKTVLLPGSLVPSQGACNVAYSGWGSFRSYEILVDAGCSCGSYVYDPRIGVRQTGRLNLQSKYTCSSQLDSIYYMYPTSQRQEIISGNLYYGSNTGSGESIYCNLKEPYQNLDLEIQVGKCDSVVECDLKFSHMPPLVDFLNDSKNEKVEVFRQYNKSTG
ncbi:unnamed protein product, partial [Allacma fusca]